jgi:hypothetical protein
MASPATSSGIISSSQALVPASSATGYVVKTGVLFSLSAFADGTNAATVTIYDNESAASGTILAQVIVKAGDRMNTINLPNSGVIFNSGLYIAVSGTGASGLAAYTLG